MYCSLDKIDLAATVDGRQVAIQTDHRSADEIDAELELAVLFAMTRAINARERDGTVYYVVANPPPLLAEALHACGAVVSPAWQPELPKATPPDPSEHRIDEIADGCFRVLARRVAAQVGTSDLAMALRMLEDQTIAAPPSVDDPAAYWRRVIELAALTGELLRTKATRLGAVGRWVQTDRALVPFGFELATPAGGSTVLFPTNRSQRVIEGGRDESLLKLLIAAEETLQRPPDAATGRLMPSLRDRRNVELEEVVWQPLLPGESSVNVELPITVCGIDGESTFGIIRREALERTPDEAMTEALRNLETEEIEIGELSAGDIRVLAIAGSFYAAEKLLDRRLMRQLHDMLGSEILVAGVPARGVLLVAPGDPALRTRFATVVRTRYDEAGGRQISPVVLVVEEGEVTGFVRDTALVRADTAPIRAETEPDRVDQPGVQIRRRGLLRRLLGRK